MRRYVLLGFLLLFVGIVVLTLGCGSILNANTHREINPLQYGLNNAKSGVERFYVLQRTHEDAQRLGVGVSYNGIKEIHITIPPNAKSIPLTQYTDFAGAKILIENKQQDFFIFALSSSLKSVNVSGQEIDRQDFSLNPILKTENKLLVITDRNLWVEKRRGHDYGVARKDVMLVRHGKGGNATVQSYCTPTIQPECYYCNVDVSKKKIIKNIEFIRSTTSTKKTYLFKIENQYNVELSNIIINTPNNKELSGDRAIYIANCVDVTISDLTINNTYSLPGKYGYGISLNNTYNVIVRNMYARAIWGVFGNSNINKAYLTNCDINRFDIHCYGRDIFFKNCNFVDLYNQFGSVYGLISFDNCTFTNFKPILMGGQYNAYTAFNVLFEKCVFNLDEKHDFIVGFSGFAQEENLRPELRKKCMPNITMKECMINSIGGLKKWYVFNTKSAKDYKGKFFHLSKVIIERLSTKPQSLQMEVFTDEIQTDNKIIIKK